MDVEGRVCDVNAVLDAIFRGVRTATFIHTHDSLLVLDVIIIIIISSGFAMPPRHP